MTFANFARAMTCTVVAFASLRASDNQELLKLDHPNGDTLCVHGAVASKGPVLTAGEDVAVFTFDQDEGSSASDSPNSAATCNFGPETRWTKNGKSGGGMEFFERQAPLGASSSVVRLPRGLLNGESFGISFWFLIPSQAPMDRDLFFISNGHLFIRWVAVRRAMEFGVISPVSGEWVGASGTIENVALSGRKSPTLEGHWFHFTGTYDGQKLRMHLDGILIGEASIQGTVAGMEEFSLGCQFWDPDPAAPNQLVGILDDLRFFTPTPATE
jgi:hypothetical protein